MCYYICIFHQVFRSREVGSVPIQLLIHFCMAHSRWHHHVKGQCKYMCLEKMDGLERDQMNPRKNTCVIIYGMESSSSKTYLCPQIDKRAVWKINSQGPLQTQWVSFLTGGTRNLNLKKSLPVDYFAASLGLVYVVVLRSLRSRKPFLLAQAQTTDSLHKPSLAVWPLKKHILKFGPWTSDTLGCLLEKLNLRLCSRPTE